MDVCSAVPCAQPGSPADWANYFGKASLKIAAPCSPTLRVRAPKTKPSNLQEGAATRQTRRHGPSVHLAHEDLSVFVPVLGHNNKKMVQFGYQTPVFAQGPLGTSNGLAIRMRVGLFAHQREETTRFIAFRSHWGFQSEFWIPGEGHEKDGVEGEGGYFSLESHGDRTEHC